MFWLDLATNGEVLETMKPANSNGAITGMTVQDTVGGAVDKDADT